jgi:hypothetical protein
VSVDGCKECGGCEERERASTTSYIAKRVGLQNRRRKRDEVLERARDCWYLLM